MKDFPDKPIMPNEIISENQFIDNFTKKLPWQYYIAFFKVINVKLRGGENEKEKISFLYSL